MHVPSIASRVPGQAGDVGEGREEHDGEVQAEGAVVQRAMGVVEGWEGQDGGGQAVRAALERAGRGKLAGQRQAEEMDKGAGWDRAEAALWGGQALRARTVSNGSSWACLKSGCSIQGRGQMSRVVVVVV